VYSLIITEIAEEDIFNTVEYIANVLKAPTAANNLLDEIERHEEILENTPNIYPSVPDEYLSQKGLRFTRIKNYLMFYTIITARKKETKT
jgi:plasmid stabilization system protein ParE